MFLLAVCLILPPGIWAAADEAVDENEIYLTEQVDLHPVTVNSFDSAINAGAAVLYEASGDRILYGKNPYTPMAMASTTKLMTALLAAESGDLDRDVTVSDKEVPVEGTALGLKAGDHISMRGLIAGLLLASGNDAANVIAYELAGSLPAFADKMNARAAEIGMKNTHFVTPSGLDAEGHAASAYDMALLGAAALKNPTLAAICGSKTMVIEMGNPKREVTVQNHNRLLSFYPDAVGLKTGFTKKAGRCLVSAARRNGVELIAVTLNDGDDWDDHMALLDFGFSELEAVNAEAPVLPPMKVAGGVTGEVGLTVAAPPGWVLPVGKGKDIVTKVELPRFLYAPVEAGTPVGRAVYLLDGKELGEQPITVTSSVAARHVATFEERMQKIYKEMLYFLIR